MGFIVGGKYTVDSAYEAQAKAQEIFERDGIVVGIEETVTVWILECDDPTERYAVNDEADMRGNYDDAVDDNAIAEGMAFEEYLRQFDKIEMPFYILDGDTYIRNRYIEALGI